MAAHAEANENRTHDDREGHRYWYFNYRTVGFHD